MIARGPWLIIFLLALLPLTASAHEIRPGYLEIKETASQVQIYWKQPVVGDRTIAISPVLSSGWLDRYNAETSITNDALTRLWKIPVAAGALEGQTVSIQGLERTITDVLLRIQFADGNEVVQILKPSHASFVVPNSAMSATAKKLLEPKLHSILNACHTSRK